MPENPAAKMDKFILTNIIENVIIAEYERRRQQVPHGIRSETPAEEVYSFFRIFLSLVFGLGIFYLAVHKIFKEVHQKDG